MRVCPGYGPYHQGSLQPTAKAQAGAWELGYLLAFTEEGLLPLNDHNVRNDQNVLMGFRFHPDRLCEPIRFDADFPLNR
jgi:hypothetical protein